MAKIKSRTPFSESNGRLIVGWAILIALVIGAVAFAQRQYLIAELQTEAASLYRLASQRADQHDAHMTALSAPAVAGADERPDLFLEVATTILRFYARIAIVARSGVTSVVLRADNAGPHTVGSSAGKAFASASLGRDTAGLAEFIAGNPQNDGLRCPSSNDLRLFGLWKNGVSGSVCWLI